MLPSVPSGAIDWSFKGSGSTSSSLAALPTTGAMLQMPSAVGQGQANYSAAAAAWSNAPQLTSQQQQQRFAGNAVSAGPGGGDSVAADRLQVDAASRPAGPSAAAGGGAPSTSAAGGALPGGPPAAGPALAVWHMDRHMFRSASGTALSGLSGEVANPLLGAAGNIWSYHPSAGNSNGLYTSGLGKHQHKPGAGGGPGGGTDCNSGGPGGGAAVAIVGGGSSSSSSSQPVARELFPRGEEPRSDSAVSDQYRCPLTKQVMKEPVVLLSDGFTYERDAIERWMASSNVSPTTHEQLGGKDLVPNMTMRAAIKLHLGIG